MANHVFISYAREDEDFVLSLAANLKRRGVPVWIDQSNIPPGVDWDQAIDDALYGCAQLLIILSPASAASGEVRSEWRTALREEKPIVPVLHQRCRIPRRLGLIQYVDFTTRGPDDADALAELLRALGAPEAASPQPQPPPPKRKPAPQILQPEMILIPAGTFLMGSDPAKDKDAKDNEQPQHTLHLPDYHIAKTPVTNAQYAAFVKATGHVTLAEKTGRWDPKTKKFVKGFDWRHPQGPSTSFEDRLDHPVVYVSWHDAVAYCDWLAELTGKPYRLPSEAEWEKAARGNDGRIYPWGNRWDPYRCNTEEAGPGGTTPVGAYSGGASPYGLLDVAGNVLEWTRSLWGKSGDAPDFRYPYRPQDGRENLDASDDVRRVVRGGSSFGDRRDARCAFRGRLVPGLFGSDVGLRVVVVSLALPSSDS